MKTLPLLTASLIAASMSLVLPAHADDAHHPEKAGAVVNAPAPVAAPTIRKMQDNAKKLQSQLNQIAKAKTETERRTLLSAHMQTMQENMMMAQGMSGMECPMMSSGGMGKGMMGSDGMMQRMQQMEKRMDMMEQMAKPAPADTLAK